MKGQPLHILFLGTSTLEGMASSRRIQNFASQWTDESIVKVSNLIFCKPGDLTLHGQSGKQGHIHFHHIGYQLKSPLSFRRFYSLGKSFLKAQKSEDRKQILYVYDIPTLIRFPLIRYAKKLGYQVFFDIVEDHNLQKKPNGWKQWIKNITQRWLVARIARLGQGAIAISHYLENWMKELTKGTGFKVFHLPITVDLSYFEQRADPNNDIPVIFYGGSFANKDGLPLLFKAIGQLKRRKTEVRLILTGKGSKRDMDAIFAALEASNISDWVDYKGFLPNDEYYALLNRCDIFCMTRINSSFANAGFPFKLGEFLATGKPVIATDVGNVSQYLQHKKNALVIPPETVDQLADAMEMLIKDPVLGKKIGKAGRSTAEEHFDTKQKSEELRQILSEL